MTDFSAHVFDLGGTLVVLDGDEVGGDEQGRITPLSEVADCLMGPSGQAGTSG